uniref:Protein phosphatase 1 regulatory subunit 15A n=1 Tax=Pogona vitticeps TaxID=103695 RepID=A0A6J0TLI8_9SAUR
MPPCIAFSQLTSHRQNTATMLICGNPFGLRVAKSLPPESSRPTPAAKANVGIMVLGRMVQFAMDRLKKYLHLWQNFPANLMAAILKGMAQGAMAILEKTMRLFEGEGLGSDGSKMEQQYLKDHLEFLIVNNNERCTMEAIESFVEDNCSGHFRKYHSPTFGKAEMDKIYLEKEGISELCVMSPSIFLNWESNWEPSSEEDSMDLENIMSQRELYEEELGDCIHPQMSLGIDGCFGKNLPGDSSHQGDLENFEGDLWQSLESTPVSQERKDNQLFYEDLAMQEDYSLENPPDFLNDAEQVEMNTKDEAEDVLNSETSAMAQGSRSSLVMSLFYSPSEEETDDEDDSEDWWDELEESGCSRMSVEGCDSGMKNLQLKDDTLHEDENTCGSFFMNKDPFHPLCFSKTIQPRRPPTAAPPEPKNRQEITVSFYLSKLDPKPEESINPPKQLWPKKAPKVNHRSSAHKFCQPDSRKNEDLFTKETPPVSQEQNQVVKKVRFSPVVRVRPLVVWDYASRSARRGPWEEMARDRCRFRRRIGEVGDILEPCLGMEHRAKVWRRIHGVPDSFQEDDSTNTSLVPPSAAAKKLCLQDQR